MLYNWPWWSQHEEVIRVQLINVDSVLVFQDCCFLTWRLLWIGLKEVLVPLLFWRLVKRGDRGSEWERKHHIAVWFPFRVRNRWCFYVWYVTYICGAVNLCCKDLISIMLCNNSCHHRLGCSKFFAGAAQFTLTEISRTQNKINTGTKLTQLVHMKLPSF